MSMQANIEAQQRFGEAVNSGNLDEIRNLMSAGVVDHDPAPDQGPGPDGFTAFFTAFRAGFPGLEITVDHLVADENNVAFAYTATGNHQGEFQGIPVTNRKIRIRGMQISRFENGLTACAPRTPIECAARENGAHRSVIQVPISSSIRGEFPHPPDPGWRPGPRPRAGELDAEVVDSMDW